MLEDNKYSTFLYRDLDNVAEEIFIVVGENKLFLDSGHVSSMPKYVTI